jgi:hypothetical protein
MDTLGRIYWLILLAVIFGQFAVGVWLFSSLVKALLAESSRASLRRQRPEIYL